MTLHIKPSNEIVYSMSHLNTGTTNTQQYDTYNVNICVALHLTIHIKCMSIILAHTAC